jgi:nitric oxide reductase subunit C
MHKTVILFFILTAAAGYTWMVYTYGTEVKKGRLDDTAAIEGQLVYQQKNCVACHQVYGLGGYMGSDLTNVMSAPGKGEAYVGVILQTGTSRMPNFHLTSAEITALKAYLTRVDESGTFPIHKPSSTYWGDLAVKR